MGTSKKHIKLENLDIKNPGFSVPDYYFDSLETKILSKVNNDIPGNYFEDVENKILSKLNIDKPKEVKVIKLNTPFFKRLVPIVAAASIILFVSLNFFNKSNTLNFDSLNDLNISNWIDLNADEASSYVLGQYLNNDDLTGIANNTATDINETDLVDYLNDTNIEDLMINN